MIIGKLIHTVLKEAMEGGHGKKVMAMGGHHVKCGHRLT